MRSTVSLLSTELSVSQLVQNKEASTGGPGFPTRYLRFGTFELDLQQQRLSKNGSRVNVQGKAYRALIALLENPSEMVSRKMLQTCLWPMDKPFNYDANLNTTVNKLRRVLHDTDGGPILIETIPRQGYRLVAKVEYADQPMFGMSAPRGGEVVGRKTKFFLWPSTVRFLGRDRSSIWFAAGIIALLIASILFGAAITQYTHRPL